MQNEQDDQNPDINSPDVDDDYGQEPERDPYDVEDFPDSDPGREPIPVSPDVNNPYPVVDPPLVNDVPLGEVDDSPTMIAATF